MASANELLNLITKERSRLTSSKAGLKNEILRATESDKSRVVNSAAFRRLQQKAQVFPLEDNAAVRSRLTHSIEVSLIGRYIAQSIIEKLNLNNEDYGKLVSFINIVETACLLHDIGNPPFGHLGESAIREWFKDLVKHNKKFEGKFIDLINFDGNPQGFRLVSYLSGKEKEGLNLTYSLLLSIIKYPTDIKNRKYPKHGMFISDREIYEKSCNALNWKLEKKFPLMLLMDEADAIAYSLSDLEDGLEKKIITLKDLKEVFDAEYFPSDEKKSPIKEFIYFKAKVVDLFHKLKNDQQINDFYAMLGQ